MFQRGAIKIQHHSLVMAAAEHIAFASERAKNLSG
jgi:hypothetical protein